MQEVHYGVTPTLHGAYEISELMVYPKYERTALETVARYLHVDASTIGTLVIMLFIVGLIAYSVILYNVISKSQGE